MGESRNLMSIRSTLSHQPNFQGHNYYSGSLDSSLIASMKSPYLQC